MTWSEMRTLVKESRCNTKERTCPRNGNGFRVVFERDDKSVQNIKYFVMTQEPAYYYRKRNGQKFRGADDVEKSLELACSNPEIDREISDRNVLKEIRSILGRDSFDLRRGDVYWSHSLLCVPNKSDKDIRDDWKAASLYCPEYHRMELDEIPCQKLKVVAIGGWALRTCLHLFENRPIDDGIQITKFMLDNRLPIETHYSPKNGTSERKDIRLYVFLHPSRREVFEKKNVSLRTVRKDEIEDCQRDWVRGRMLQGFCRGSGL